MARLLTAKCPRCGADVELAPRVEVVECRYCRQRSVVDWGRGHTTVPPAEPNLGRIVAPTASVLTGVWLVLALPVLLSIAGAIAFTARSKPAPTDLEGDPPAIPEIPSIPAIPGVTDRPPAKPVAARLVDAAELVKTARAQVLAEAPNAAFDSAVFFNVVNGLVDTAQDNAGTVSFGAKLIDPKAPPGKDVSSRRYSAHVRRGAIATSWMSWGAPDDDRALDVPACPSSSAWTAAVKTGVPANAIATLHLYFNGAFTPKSPTVWSIRVEGHDEHRREVDARTCVVVKDWSKRGR